MPAKKIEAYPISILTYTQNAECISLRIQL